MKKGRRKESVGAGGKVTGPAKGTKPVAPTAPTKPLTNSARTPRKPQGEARPRHPKFDEYWEKNKGLVYFWSHKLQGIFGGESESYLADLTMRLNDVLFNFDPKKAKFTTYFSCHLVWAFGKGKLRRESEARAAAALGKSAVNISQIGRAENPGRMGGANDRDMEWAEPVKCGSMWARGAIEGLGGEGEFWDRVNGLLTEREALAIKGRFMLGLTLAEVGEVLLVSKERVRQIVGKAMEKLRVGLADVE